MKKVSNFIENLESDMIRLESIRISSPLLSEHISDVKLGVSSSHSV